MSQNLHPLPSRFFLWEFACPCGCGFGSKPEDVSEDLVYRLNIVRYLYGQAMVVTSGARCRNYNARIGGVPDSAHTPHPKDGKCYAADIRVRLGADRYHLLHLAKQVGIVRVGLDVGFIHLDVSDVLPSPTLWTY